MDDPLAAELRTFGPWGVLAMLGILAGTLFFGSLSALLVVWWAWRSHTAWHELGFQRARSWGRELAVGILFGVALKLVMKALVMPLLGAPALNPRYQYLAGSPQVLPFAVYVAIFAGLGEETVYRGYLFERLGKLLGSGTGARVTTVLLTTSLFALAHLADQGVAGAEQATMTGLAFGVAYWATENLVPVIVAHAAFDLTAVALIYWRMEGAVAHAVFR